MRCGIPGLLGVVLVWGLLSTACRATRDEAPVSSHEEITVYTSLLDEGVKTYLASFQVAYPAVKVKVVRESAGALVNRLLAERRNPQADVIWGLEVASLVLLEWHDMLVPYAPAGFTRVQPQFCDMAYTQHADVHRQPYWVGIVARMLAFCINPERLDQHKLPPPVTWRDLSNPVYRGHLVLPDPVVSGTGYSVLDMVLQHYGKIKGWEYLDALHQNVIKYVSPGAEPCRLVGKGEVAIGVTYDQAAFHQQSAGMPIKVIFPSEGSGWDMAANALVKKPSITVKPGAKTFLDWAISDSAMQAYGRSGALTAVRTEILPPPGFPSDPVRQLFDKDIMLSAAHRDLSVHEWQHRYGNKEASGARGD